MQGKEKFYRIVILGMLSAIGPFSIDMYLPGFPAIARDLHASVADITLSLSSFFIGIAAGQLLYGPLLDRYGRKKPLYYGISLYLIASIGCAFSNTVEMLIILRLFQALGACAGMVAARAMVRDLFPVEQNAKIFSLLMLVVGVSPLIAPTAGGYVISTIGWPYVFVILAVIASLLLVAVHYFMPDSRSPDTSVSLLPVPIVKSFIMVSREPQFYTYAFTGAIAAAGMYAYIAGSPYVFMSIFKVTDQQYGWIFAGIALGLITASQVNSYLLRRYKSEQIIPVSVGCQVIAGILLFFGTYFHLFGLAFTILLIGILMCCQGFSFPNASALSLAPFPRNAGTASALMGAVQLGIGATSSALVGIFTDGTAVPMAGVMASCALLSFCVLMTGRRIIRYRATTKEVQEEVAEMIINS